MVHNEMIGEKIIILLNHCEILITNINNSNKTEKQTYSEQNLLAKFFTTSLALLWIQIFLFSLVIMFQE